MKNMFYSALDSFDAAINYRWSNPFTKKQRLPRVITRYGGKGNFYEDYEPYIREIAEDNHANIFVDCFGGGGTMSMMALLMTDYKTGAPLFDEVHYNDVDISAYSTFITVQNEEDCEKLVDRIIDTAYSKVNFEKAHEIIALLNLSDLREYMDNNPDYLNSNRAGNEREFKGYLRASQLSSANLESILGSNWTSMSYRDAAYALAEVSETLKKSISHQDIAYYAFIENALSFNGSGTGFRNVENYNRCNIDYGKKMCLRARKLLDIHPLIKERLIAHNGSYLDLMDKLDDNGTADNIVWFLDPPYYTIERAKGATAVYKNEFNNTDHMFMINRISAMRHWMLCGYKRDEQEGEQGDLSNIVEWQSNIYGSLRKIPEVEFIDLGLKARPSSSKAASEGDPHEILWLRR